MTPCASLYESAGNWFACRWALALGVVMVTANLLSAAEPTARVLKHVVLYKFRDDATAAQIQAVVDTFSALPKQIDTIIGFEAGTNVSTEGKSEGLTHCFVVTFRDQAGLDRYLKHPAHEAYVQVVRPRREKVVVFDYWVGP